MTAAQTPGSAPNQNTGAASNPRPQPPGASPKPQGKGADRNGNGRIDPEDILIFLRDLICWLVGWRGAMLVALGFVGYAGYLNVRAWQLALAGTGSALYGGFLAWAVLQTFELLPILDDLLLHSALAALVRLQRKPIEVPVINETVSPQAKNQLRRYINRERKQDIAGEFLRYFCYGIELAVLILGSGIVTAIGIQWRAVLLALIGIGGVELGLRLFARCAEKLLTREEREMLMNLRRHVGRTTIISDQ